MPIPQTVFRPYRVIQNAPLATGMFRLVVEAIGEPLPPFQAGQWVNVRLLKEGGGEWAKAAYSLASAPRQGTQTVEFGIKIAGEFTKRLAALPMGSVIDLQGPWGVFTSAQKVSHLVCIAGGIGVTPFVSMMREAVESGQRITLLYANRSADEAAYLDELMAMAATHSHLAVVPTYTRACPKGWTGERGRINEAMLARHLVSAAPDAVYLLCGPDTFMASARALLLARGVEAKKIKQESFG